MASRAGSSQASKALEVKGSDGKVTEWRKLESVEVLVGVPEDKSSRNDGISNAMLAYIHDQGSPAQNIPARPFMQPGINSVMPEIEKHLQAAAKAAVDINMEAAIRSLDRAGLAAQAGIKKKIVDGPFAPLAPATLAARRSKGRQQDKPLIDTGQLIRSIQYVVRKK